MRMLLLPLALAAALFPARTTAQTTQDEGKTITVELQNGDKITGILKDAGTANLVITHDVLGDVSIPRAAIKPAPPPAPPVDLDVWAGSFDVAFNGSEGNTTTRNFRAGIHMSREDEASSDDVNLWYRRATSDNDPTEDKGFGQLRHEWKIKDSKWGTFVQGTMEKDRFADYDWRGGLAGGASYRFVDNEKHKLRGRVGAGLSHKWGLSDDDVDETTYEGLLGLDWNWQVTKLNTFSFTTDIYPSISPSGEIRTVTSAKYDIKVSEENPWYVRLGTDHFYDSQPGAGKKNNDWNYYLGIGRSF